MEELIEMAQSLMDDACAVGDDVELERMKQAFRELYKAADALEIAVHQRSTGYVRGALGNETRAERSIQDARDWLTYQPPA